jgi:hypothetical protein
MKYRLVNDCSHYHAGSALVAVQIRRFLKDRGFVEAEDADTVIINGEGTFHHDSPSALRIIESVRKYRGTKTVHFLNAVWQNMGSAIPDVAVASLRETLSFTEFKSRHPTAQSYVSPDISLTYDWRDPPQRTDKLLVFDSVSEQATQALKQVSDKLGATFVRMCEVGRDYVGLLNLVASHRAAITGRYHGAMFAAITGTPLLCAPSNTWKTRGFLADVGVEGAFFKTEEELVREARRGNFSTIPAPKIESAKRTWGEVFSRIAEIASAPKVPVKADATCVLVGNGPSLLSKRIGSIIDSHDEVIRFNSFRTQGFARHTGSKTTLWSTFGKGTLPEDASAFDKIVFIHGDSGDPSVSGKQVFRIPAPFYQKLRSDIRAISTHKNAKVVNPTSGFLVANWLLHNGVKRLHLAGFDHFSKTCSQAHHYWEPKAYGRPADHDGEAERLLLIPWVLAGRVSYLT